MKKKAKNAARAAHLRRLAGTVTREKLYDSEHDWAHVVNALFDFAAMLEGKPVPQGRPDENFMLEQRFLQLTHLNWLSQTSAWRKAKSPAFARTQVASLTGWKIPRRSAGYSRRVKLYAAAAEAKTAEELEASKRLAVSSVPAKSRALVEAALGLRDQ